MKPEPDNGRWSIPYRDRSGDEFSVEYDAHMVDMFHGGNGVVCVQRDGIKIDWPINRIDWLVARLTAAKVGMEEARALWEDEMDDLA